MTRIHWVRHAPTHQKRLVGHWDVAADTSDHAALNALAHRLPSDAPIVSSDLIRSVETADVIGGARLRLAHDAGFREFDFGDWDGKTFDAVAQSHPDLSFQFWDGNPVARPPNGESWTDLTVRINRALQPYLADNYPDVIIVAHFGVILTQIARIGGLAAKQAMSHRIDNLSTTILDYGREPAIITVNRPALDLT